METIAYLFMLHLVGMGDVDVLETLGTSGDLESTSSSNTMDSNRGTNSRGLGSGSYFGVRRNISSNVSLFGCFVGQNSPTSLGRCNSLQRRLGRELGLERGNLQVQMVVFSCQF
ncbi:hypothetical protein BDF14DRAFT_1865540 [Spinellus fusiger]|nr:hypothetical protein BDF14DRAFT_1865540 [Spinellus fusiger]